MFQLVYCFSNQPWFVIIAAPVYLSSWNPIIERVKVRLRKKKRKCPNCPTDHFANSEHQNLSDDVFFYYTTFAFSDFEELKVWKGRSGGIVSRPNGPNLCTFTLDTWRGNPVNLLSFFLSPRLLVNPLISHLADLDVCMRSLFGRVLGQIPSTSINSKTV